MGRQVRRVPKDWQHPRKDGAYVPLFEGLSEDDKNWREWTDTAPDPEDYMPEWPDAECTHFMMYETTTEGTPISPAFETTEELARWLADNQASAFAGMTATYEQWLKMCITGGAVSAVIDSTGLHSGVEML